MTVDPIPALTYCEPRFLPAHEPAVNERVAQLVEQRTFNL